MRLTKFIRSVGFCASVFAAMVTSAGAMASDWSPSGPIMLQIGAGVGGETDAMGRTFAKVMEEQTGWKVVVENKPGGGGIAMLSSLKHKKADGKTVGIAINMPVLVNLVLRGDKLPFNLDDFNYLGTLGSGGLAIVTKGDAPFNNIDELVAYSKENGAVAIATDAKPQELIMNNIAKETDAKFKLLVTKSGSEVLQFLLGNKAMVGLSNGRHIPYLETGELKMLASANSKRHSYAPQTPTLIEQGFNLFVDPTWYFATPKGLKPEVQQSLASAINNAVQSDKVKQIVQNILASEAENLGPDGTRKMLDDGFEGVKVLFN